MMVIVLNMDWFVFLKKKKTHFALIEPTFCSKARGCVGPGCNITGFGPRPFFFALSCCNCQCCVISPNFVWIDLV